MSIATKDPAALFFGTAAALTLVVSLPATYAMLALFHAPWLALLAVIVFEIGAVGAKLITLAIPSWARRLNVLTLVLLALTTGANYAEGLKVFGAAAIDGPWAAVRTDAPGLATWAAAGLFPLLLFVWLTAFTARLKQLGGLADGWRAVAEAGAAVERDRRMVEVELAQLVAARRNVAEGWTVLEAERRQLVDRRETVEVVTVETTLGRRSLAEIAAAAGVAETTLRRKLEK